MSKIWLVAEQQFKKEVFKRGFLLALIAMPLFLGFTAAMGWLGERMRQQTTTLGQHQSGSQKRLNEGCLKAVINPHNLARGFHLRTEVAIYSIQFRHGENGSLYAYQFLSLP